MQFRISLSNFLDVIYGVSLRGIGEDKKCWMPAKSRGFEVSSYHWALFGVCNQSSLGEAFGSQRFLPKLRSLFGLQLWEIF